MSSDLSESEFRTSSSAKTFWMEPVFSAARRGDIVAIRRYVEQEGFNVNLLENSTSKQGKDAEEQFC